MRVFVYLTDYFKSAVGVASGNGIDIIEIVKNADSAMYADKQLFHRR